MLPINVKIPAQGSHADPMQSVKPIIKEPLAVVMQDSLPIPLLSSDVLENPWLVLPINSVQITFNATCHSVNLFAASMPTVCPMSSVLKICAEKFVELILIVILMRFAKESLVSRDVDLMWIVPMIWLVIRTNALVRYRNSSQFIEVRDKF